MQHKSILLKMEFVPKQEEEESLGYLLTLFHTTLWSRFFNKLPGGPEKNQDTSYLFMGKAVLNLLGWERVD